MAIIALSGRRQWNGRFADPVLDDGEAAVDSDTGVLRVGDGVTVFSALANVTSPFRLSNDVIEIVDAGAPTDAVTGADVAGPGSRYTDITAGKLYINTGTKAVPAWVVVGSQS